MSVAIFATAFLIRVVYVLMIREHPGFDAPSMDALYHDKWARAIAAGEPFLEGPYFRAPLYAWFLGSIYWLFGPNYLLPRLLQAILGSISCVVVYYLGRDAFDRRVGAVAGFGAATYWILVYFDGELLIPTLITLLDLLVLWTLMRASRSEGRTVSTRSSGAWEPVSGSTTSRRSSRSAPRRCGRIARGSSRR